MNLPDDLRQPLELARDGLGMLARDVRWLETAGSTNDIAARWADTGAAEGSLVVADAQTAGRGRQGRAWASPPGAGLYLSIVLKPREAALPLLTIAAGVAVAEGIEAATGLAPALKWPNDVYVAERKLAGLLAEGASDGVILGVGVNVMPAAYPPEIAARATSLEAELGRGVDRGVLLAAILTALARRYAELQQGKAAAIAAAWRARARTMLGRPVTWAAGGRSMNGVAETIDESGALLVRTAAGTERIISGEVVWS